MTSTEVHGKHGLTPIESVVAESNEGDKMGRVAQIGAMRVLGLDPEDENYYVNYPTDHRSTLVRKVCIFTPNSQSCPDKQANVLSRSIFV